MNFTEGLKTVLEIAVVLFTIWAVFNEKRFTRFEKNIVAKIRRRRLRVIEGGSVVTSTYVPETRKA